MGLRIVYGRAGTGKSQFCFNEISNLVKVEKIYVITPEQFSFTAEKKLMDALKENATFNAEVITFDRMAYRILSEVGGVTSTHLSKCGKAMLVYSILNTQKRNLKFLGKSDENVELSLNAITELKKHGISVEMLRQELNNTDNKYLKTKLQDINLIYENFQEKIAENYIDETDMLSILAEQIDKTDMFKDSLIYIDEFSGFTYQEYEIIKKLLKIAKQVTITVCADNINVIKNPDTDIFYSNKITTLKIKEMLEDDQKTKEINLENVQRFKSKELQHLEKNLYNTTYKKYNENVNNFSLFLAKNPYSEIEYVAKNILKLVRDNNYRYKEIAVITKNINTYSSLIRAIFNKYQIPLFIDEKRDLSQNIVVQYVLSIVEIFNKNWSTESVFNYIKTGFVGIDAEEIFKLENYCTKWGIQYNKWKENFVYGITEENKAEIDRLNEIRKQIVNPLIELRVKLYKEKTAENISKALYNFLNKQNFETKLQQKMEYLESLGLIDIANEYKESYKILIDILDQMVMIFKDDKLTFNTYISLLKVGLKNSGLGKIPGTADQVIVGDVERSRSHKVRAIFIIGLNDGVFPSINKDEGFLNDEDRSTLKEHGIELAKGTIENLYEDNFNIYKAFTTAEEKLYLSYSSSDTEIKSLRPSILISKLKKIFPKLQEESDVVINKYEILTENTTYEELVSNISRLKSGESIDEIWYSVYKFYENNANWKDKLEKSLQGLFYTNLPEQLNKENVDKLYGDILNTSISKLEKYRSCPFSYYLQYGLKLKEKEELKVQSLNTGILMHEVIDEFFENVNENQINLKELTDEKINKIVEQIVNEKLKLNKNYIFISSNRYKLLVIRLKRILVKALKYIIETLNQSKFDVLGTEVEFGKNKEYKPIVINLDNGKKVEIVGKIDRIDIARSCEGNYLRIIDYKSSAKNIDLNEVYAGIQIQLLTYLDAVCKEEDLMPAGVLYFNLLEQMVKADRRMNDEEIIEKIKANFKMKGLILADVKVVKMHDTTLSSGASKLVPAYIDKSGNLGSKTNGVTKEQFADLEKYIYKTIAEISKEILEGKIDLKPYYKKGTTPCKYCSYKGICGFNAGFCKNEYNYIGSKSKEEILKKIKCE